MIPQTDSDNSLPVQNLEKHVQGCCPYGCPGIEIDLQLACILSAWPTLNRSSRNALLACVTTD